MEVPWALDDSASGGNLADVARSCLQQKGLQLEADGCAGLRAQEKVQSSRKLVEIAQEANAGSSRGSVGIRSERRSDNSRGSFGVRSEIARADNSGPCRGGKRDNSRGATVQARRLRKDQESNLLGTAALANFVAEISNENRSGPLRECANKVRPTPKLCDVGRLAWQEPVKSYKVFR